MPFGGSARTILEIAPQIATSSDLADSTVNPPIGSPVPVSSSSRYSRTRLRISSTLGDPLIVVFSLPKSAFCSGGSSSSTLAVRSTIPGTPTAMDVPAPRKKPIRRLSEASCSRNSDAARRGSCVKGGLTIAFLIPVASVGVGRVHRLSVLMRPFWFVAYAK